ncbi:MAG: radical SAM protein [Desulfomonilaceae bacterium]|nr:radical SAM protein [Desulfomonilaceae bacterium]
MMKGYESRTSNIAGRDVYPLYAKFFTRALKLLLASHNRRIRREKGVTPVDALFNFVKLSFLEYTMLKYRHMVGFDGSVVIDSTFPPYPSSAFDKRLSNYLNNLDLMELPSGIVSVSTTNCCPYACAFCSTNAKRKTDDDLDEELLKKTITEIETLGTPSIILHGGEPMYRYDRFLRLVKHVSNDTCLWMFTTGYAVTGEKAEELKANGLFGVWVSLDHYRPDVHNGLRGNPQAFENACTAVEHFKRAGVYTCLSLVPPDDLVEPENFKKYYEFARDLGVAEIRVMEKKPSGREACRGARPHSPVLEQLQKDLYMDPAYRNHPPLSGLSTWLEKDQAFGCQCRFEYLFVTSAGDVQPCEVSEISFGNINEEPFRDIYNRICRAFPAPSTGCIPMVMYPEVRHYQKVKDRMTTLERAGLAARIIDGFQARGKVPGAFGGIWSVYKRRLAYYKSRKAAREKKTAIPN